MGGISSEAAPTIKVKSSEIIVIILQPQQVCQRCSCRMRLFPGPVPDPLVSTSHLNICEHKAGLKTLHIPFKALSDM